MSDNFTILIPASPGYVPCKEAQAQAVALMKAFAPNADEVKVETTEEIRFIDCGANFERVDCPDCGAEIAMDWWSECMSEEFSAGVRLETRFLPCCGGRRSLAELDYEWPQGFARFSLSAMNAGVGELSDAKKSEFEQVLGCELKTIYQHL